MLQRPRSGFYLAIVAGSFLFASGKVSAQLSPQILDSANFKTTYLPSTYRPADSMLVRFVNSDTCFYYEVPPTTTSPDPVTGNSQTKNWYWESGTYWNSKAGKNNPPYSFAYYARRTPVSLIGRAIGATANFRADVPGVGKYLVYTYVCNTFGASDNAFMTIHKGSGLPADSTKTGVLLDSLRYNLLAPGADVPAFINLALVKKFINQTADGAWLPMTVVDAPAGNKAITVSIGADTLTNGPLRVDAIRILRSSETADLEFGRRPRMMFDSARVPEMFPLTTIGQTSIRSFKFFNLGSSSVTINSVASAGGQFHCIDVLPKTIQPDACEVLSIGFSPIRGGTIIDTLIIQSNDTKEPAALWTMVGNGVSPLWLTIDQPPGLQAGPNYWLPQGVDSTYYETPPAGNSIIYNGNDGLYNNSGTSCWGGTNRVTPNAVGGGSPAGASGNYVFTIPSTSPYLAYVYLLSSVNNADNNLLKVRRQGESTYADTVRFNSNDPGRDVATYISRGFLQTFDTIWSATLGKYVANPNQDGAWMPLSCVNLAHGTKATVTWAADALTSKYFRFDAVRLIRSDKIKDLEFGRREKIGFLEARRVPETFFEVIVGTSKIRSVRMWSLGSQAVTVTGITGTSGKFSSSSHFPVSILPGTFKDVDIVFTPAKEEETIDTLSILSDDSTEPVARWIMIGTGINYNFILNASEGGTEPMWNVPGTPTSQYQSGYPAPEYLEFPSTNWLSFVASGIIEYPIAGGNSYGRVYIGSGVAEARFTFTLPAEMAGRYFMEYNVPNGSSSYRQQATLDIITPARSDTQRIADVAMLADHISFFSPFGKVAAVPDTFVMNSGGPTTLRLWSNILPSSILRLYIDLLRIHAVSSSITGVGRNGNQNLPERFECSQNYPNPFNPSTTIEFALPVQSRVTIEIFNTIGQRASVPLRQEYAAGLHQFTWQPVLASGIYFYRLTAVPVVSAGKSFVQVRKMVLLK